MIQIRYERKPDEHVSYFQKNRHPTFFILYLQTTNLRAVIEVCNAKFKIHLGLW